jgi:hypothetical protein
MTNSAGCRRSAMMDAFEQFYVDLHAQVGRRRSSIDWPATGS